MCFVNAVLQLLVHCPPFWNQSRDLGRLMGRRGQGKGQQTGGSTTVLVDATVRLLDEFVYKEKPSLIHQSLQKAEKWKAREDEEEKNEDDDTDPFIPTYMYDAMKEKRHFKNMLVRSCAYAAPF
jgi:ubiquitin carboxyl-terminal hydrolase 10